MRKNHNYSSVATPVLMAISVVFSAQLTAQNFTVNTQANQAALPKGTVTQTGPISNPNSRLCLDVQRATADDGTNVQLGVCQNGTASWDLIDLGGGEYAIINRLTKRALDVAGGISADGTNVQQYTWNNSGAQRWRIETLANSSFQIVNQHSGKCLDIAENATNAGANIHQWRCHGGANQQWQFARATSNSSIFRSNAAPPPIATPPSAVTSVGGESVKPVVVSQLPSPTAANVPINNLTGRIIYSGMVVSRASNMCLDLKGAQTQDGANVHQWTCNNTSAQLWDFYDQGRGEFAIAVRVTNKVLDVWGATTNNGANIVQHAWNGGGNQRWRLEPAGRGFFKLVSTASNKCVDVDMSNGGKNDGANVTQWDCHGGENQQWRIEVSGSGAGWQNYRPSSQHVSPPQATQPEQRYSDAPPNSVIGSWEGYNPVYQSTIRLSIYSDGTALAVIDNQLRVNGYFRNKQLFLGAERYDVQSTRRGMRTIQVGNNNNTVNYSRVR